MTGVADQPYVYVVRMNVYEERRTEFDVWYGRLHGPDVVLDVPGFLAARSYRTSVGNQRVLSIYDMTDPAILNTPDYAKMRDNDPQGNDIRASAISDATVCIYSEVARSPQTLSDGRLDLPRFTAPYVSTIRFSVDDPAKEGALIEWFASTGPKPHAPRSALGSYLCRTSAPATPSTDPKWAVITDWIAQDGGEQNADSVTSQMSAVAGTIGDVQYDFGRRIYAYGASV